MIQVETIKLNNGMEMPVLGFGTYLSDNTHIGKYVEQAIRAGYRLIDTAAYYHNEAAVGHSIHKSGVAREDIFLTTKVMSDGYDATIAALNDSFTKLAVDYCDLVLIHWPTNDSIGTYQALESFVKDGKVRAIGLSNFNLEETEEILNIASVKPVVNQVETHINFQQKKLHQYLSERDIVHQAWSPLGEGALLGNSVVKELANKYKKTPAQIMLRFLIKEQIVVIPKSTRLEHIKNNIDIFDFSITNEDMNLLRLLDKKQSISGWPQSMDIEKEY